MPSQSIGQFRKQQRERSLLTPEERVIVKAFNKGAQAARADELRRSPYLPTSEQHGAWLLGYDENAPRYTLATRSGISHTESHGGENMAEMRSSKNG